MNTAFVLMAQYNGRVIIPIDIVCRDYFTHLTAERFKQKVALGEINLPMVRMEKSQKSTMGIHISDLAAYIDARRNEAARELEAMR